MRALLAVTVAVVLLAGMPAAAQGAPSGAGVTIAILDTGIDSAHSEVSGRVARQSFAEPVVPGPIPGGVVDLPLAEDPDGQGTAVASIAAGRTLGNASGASLLDLQVSAKYTAQPTVDPVTESAAIGAMDALLRDPERAQVVLLSFAQAGVSESGGRTLAQQARGLWDAGVLVVVPTGPSPNPLSGAAHVLTVGGSESCPNVAGERVKPDLVAPSQGLTAAAAADPTAPQQSATTTVSGSAYAAAQVAGVAALLLEVQPGLPVDALAAFLRDTARDVFTQGPDGCGFGGLDQAAAIDWASTWRDPLAAGSPRDTPALALPLLLVGLVAAAWTVRRHG